MTFAAKAEGVWEYKLMSQWIAKSNALRKAAKGKEDEMKALDKQSITLIEVYFDCTTHSICSIVTNTKFRSE